MKKLLLVAFIALIALLSVSCVERESGVLGSVGEYAKLAYYTHGEFQDYTDYGKYLLASPELENNAYLKQIDSDSKASFVAHLDVYEPFVKEYCGEDIVYDFDRSMISDSDYIYIYDDPAYREYGNFDIWFYDYETDILYYFHTNI